MAIIAIVSICPFAYGKFYCGGEQESGGNPGNTQGRGGPTVSAAAFVV